jgi:3-(3-hydroxy-phenyl)propionate hydroxylase
MLAAQAAGAPALPPPKPSPFTSGCLLAHSVGAGELFPQPTVGDGPTILRLDDGLGDEAWLIARASTRAAAVGVRLLNVDDEALAPFRTAVLAWLDQHQAQAVLVRPDRYVFGAGAPGALLDAWTASLNAQSVN